MTADTGRLQDIRRLVLLGLVVALLTAMAFTGSLPQFPALHEVVEYVGRLLIAICILGRCWCTLYIGGRKIRELVAVGPYSLCRNPLYTLSIIGAVGAGAQFGSIAVAVVFGVIVWAVFRFVVTKEEALLREVHGEAYEAYFRTTPRFLPDFRRWRDVEVVEAMPRRMWSTLLDGMQFLIAIPLAEFMEYLQETGVLPVMLHLI